jgi:hypothetical protein
MIGWIYKLLTGKSLCQHKWEIIDKGPTDRGGIWYDLQCKHCGNIKTRKCQ